MNLLLSFGGSLAAKCMSLFKKPCLDRPSLIDLNLIKLNYLPFVIRLDKRNGSCNAVNDWSTKICAPNKKRYKC